MTAPTHSPVEVANAHMIVESHRRMVDAGIIDPDELLESAEVLAAAERRLRLDLAVTTAESARDVRVSGVFWAVAWSVGLIGAWEAAVKATHCGLCNRNGITTALLTRFPGAAPICPLCDRVKCGKCKQSLIEGTEKLCPTCGADVRIRKGATS
jgi:hypothetical protein